MEVTELYLSFSRPFAATAGTAAMVVSAALLCGTVMAQTAPLPRDRPQEPSAGAVPDAKVVIRPLENTAPPQPKPVAFVRAALPRFGFPAAKELSTALDAISANDYARAGARGRRLDDPVDRMLLDWAIARAPNNPLSFSQIQEINRKTADWPDQDRLRLRAEQALLRSAPSVAQVLAFYADEQPLTYAGRFALAKAWHASGEKARGDRQMRKLWREGRISDSTAERLLTGFKTILSRDDHKHRLAQLLYDGKTALARRQARRLGNGYPELAEAVITAMSRKRRNATAQLRKVPKTLQGDPLYQFAKIRSMRRHKQEIAAAKLLISIKHDPDELVDPDRWWDEQRDLSRQLLDKNRADLAYQIVAAHNTRSGKEQVEAEFHSGWYALRFLEKPQLALPHFERLAEIATIPRSTARAHYWLARTHLALGDKAMANKNAEVAARHGQTYYGQLAREFLGLTTTGAETVPTPTAADRLRFSNRTVVKVAERLAAAGHAHRASAFLIHLAETVDSPGEVALAATLARRIGQPRVVLSIAKAANRRGLAVGALATPLIVIPSEFPVPESIDRAVVYAIAHQESSFNVGAKSWAGARGLMQMMPRTARATARSAGRPYSQDRLTGDAKYSATLGAHHLGQLMDGLRGSYIMTFAGYNAGQGRAERWVRKYGDPRGGRVDPVDWVERIPFDETRDYVQRVMANLQAYRSRLGHALAINADLKHGKPVK